MRIATLGLTLALTGCAFFPHIAEIEKARATGAAAKSGYGFSSWLDAQEEEKRPLPDPAIVITMSGGGMRAAALAYSVLAELAKIEAPCRSVTATSQSSCSLIDNVVLVSGISGGSFTASAFALDGRAILQSESAYAKDFLPVNLEAEALKLFVEPRYWGDRTQKAINLLKEKAKFGDTTYEDLTKRQRERGNAFLLLSSTDIDSGRTFPYLQDNFDDLCANLGRLEVARATGASGSFPYVLNGIRLRNYHFGDFNCTDAATEPPVETSVQQLKDKAKYPLQDVIGASTARYRLSMRLAKSDHEWSGTAGEQAEAVGLIGPPSDRYVKELTLFDGGLGDNLGIRTVTDLLSDRAIIRRMADDGAHQIILLEVNAKSDKPEAHLRSFFEHSYLQLVGETAGGAVDRVTELSSYVADERLNFVQSGAPISATTICGGRDPCIYFSRIDADLISDCNLREAFWRIGTFDELFGRPAANSFCDNPTVTKLTKFAVIQEVAHALFAQMPCLRRNWNVALTEGEYITLTQEQPCRLFAPGRRLETAETFPTKKRPTDS